MTDQAGSMTVKGPGRVTVTTLRPDPATRSGLGVGLLGVSAMAELAVQEWFRVRTFSLSRLANEFGLEFCVTDMSVVNRGVIDADDEVAAFAEPVGPRYFTVRLAKAVAPQTPLATVRESVVMVQQPGTSATLPEELEPMAVTSIDGLRTAVTTHDPQFEARDLDARLLRGDIGWQVEHAVTSLDVGYRGRMQHLSHVRLIEEAIDRYLHDHGSTVRQRIDSGQRLAAPRFRVRLVNDGLAGDRVVIRVNTHQVLRGNLMDLRVDAHVERAGRSIPVSTSIGLIGIEAPTPDGYVLQQLSSGLLATVPPSS